MISPIEQIAIVKNKAILVAKETVNRLEGDKKEEAMECYCIKKGGFR